MKNIKILWALGLLILASCADLEIENENAPDRARALANSEDILSLLDGATNEVMFDQHSLYNVHIALFTDQTTATNRYLSFWDYAFQPRQQLLNLTTNDDLAVISSAWNTNNSVISSCNLVINSVLADGLALVNEDEEDLTQAALAGAYFARGIAHGTIANMYDQGYVVNENTELSAIELLPHGELAVQAEADILKAISIVDSENVGWVFWKTQNVDATLFKQLAYSYLARILISEPRSKSEAASLDYAKIKGYAEKGITSDFTPPGSANIWANSLSWSQYNLGTGAGYLPTDQKIAWLFDNSQPKDYPTDPSNNLLPPVTTDDARADLYYGYTTDFGYLREDRDPNLFSNYYIDRWPNLGENDDYPNSIIPFFLKAELDYIIAECEWKTGNNTAALSRINAGPRSTVGGLASSTDSSDGNLEYLLHYEYSIELDYTGKAIQWAFMRRHNLLQKGTALHYPVPATEMEIFGLDVYTYGGVSGADGVNTADGSNSWK